MHAVASADAPHSSGDVLFRSEAKSSCYTVPAFAQTVSSSNRAMLRPFHSREDQCAAERRLKAERYRDASSKAGFLGQLQQLNFVRQQMESMRSSAHASPEARFGERLDLSGERWSTLPGTAPPPFVCRPAIASSTFPMGPGRTGCGGAPGFGHAFAKAGAGRRRRPVHVVSTLVEDDPALIDFSEEPEDPRVYLPAHRIGDLLPETATEKKEPRQRQQVRSSKPGVSKSMPSLHIAARRLPIRPARSNGYSISSFGAAGYGGAGGAISAKPMSRQQEIARPLPKAFDVDNVFPDAPEDLKGEDLGDDEDIPD